MFVRSDMCEGQEYADILNNIKHFEQQKYQQKLRSIVWKKPGVKTVQTEIRVQNKTRQCSSYLDEMQQSFMCMHGN